jgi:hypothetical protein
MHTLLLGGQRPWCCVFVFIFSAPCLLCRPRRPALRRNRVSASPGAHSSLPQRVTGERRAEKAYETLKVPFNANCNSVTDASKPLVFA